MLAIEANINKMMAHEATQRNSVISTSNRNSISRNSNTTATSSKKRLEAEKAVRNAIERSEKKKQKEIERRQSQIDECSTIWNKEILPQWSIFSKSKRVKDLCAKGIPPNIRGKVWPLLAGSEIDITEELFANLIVIAELSSERQSINLDPTTSFGKDYSNDNNDNDNNDNNNHNNGDNNNDNNNKNNNDDDDDPQYEDRSVRKTFIPNRSKTLILIEYDLPRTFPTLGFFHDGGDMQLSLERILQAYTCFRPSVGYVQGMSYLAAVLLLYMDELDAFKCLVNILNRRNNMDFYLLKKEAIDKYVECFDFFFEAHLPTLYHHMREEGLTSEMYLMDWNLALFSKALPLEAASRIWDCYLVEGEVFIIRAALGILKMFATILGSNKLEEIMAFLMHLPEDINVDELLSNIAQIKVTDTWYEKKRAEIYGEKLEQKDNIFSSMIEYFKFSDKSDINFTGKNNNSSNNNDNTVRNSEVVRISDSRKGCIIS